MIDVNKFQRDNFLKHFGECFENGVPEDLCETIDYIFHRLVTEWKVSKRAVGIFKSHYLDGESYGKIAKRYGISRQRPRQIGYSVMRKMWSQNNPDIIKVGLNAYEKSEKILTIENIGLSVRAYRCLRRGGIDSINDLLNVSSVENLEEIRQLGKITLNEIITKIHSHGLKMKWEKGDNNNE